MDFKELAISLIAGALLLLAFSLTLEFEVDHEARGETLFYGSF